MARVFRFVRELYSNWQAAWLGTVSIIAAIFLRATGHKDLTWGSFALFASICLVVAACQVWSKQEKQIEEFKKDHPKLFLRYVEPSLGGVPNTRLEISGFYVQVEGPKKAFAVKISSPDTVGVEHSRVETSWGVISHPVGNDPIPVSILCTQCRGVTRNTELGSQLEAFRRYTNSADLIAIIQFKDVDGNECPQRKFKISRERDVTGHMATHCDFIKI